MEENIIIAGKNKMPSRVLLIDDHPLMRRGIRQLLESTDDFLIIGEVGSGLEGVEWAVRELPDLIILDLNMKGLSGLDTLKALRREDVDSRVVILTVSDARNDIFTLIDAGADGYLLKDTDPLTLLEQIQDIASGKVVYSDVVKKIVSERQAGDDPIYSLTSRELDVLTLVAKGLSNKQIANELFISEETVKVHIRNLLRKLNVHSRLAATIVYLEHFGKK
ncbi:response regulator [Actinobacillus delphinicola]|uniref:Two component LuxR family transcriptional regulator n=1 Tax=Actinobacillus delphinicola TaxID=51161 RepID=A0A448TTE6_9PAST|nr:response regulator [Actinobacillus delphinicola]VEJ09272.1 two component LuxR family transcriptional regulator [Actinobacillus delphinicola]